MGIGTGYCCSSCKFAYVPLKNDIVVLEYSDKHCKEPYKLWCADLLECPKCEHIIITGFGQQPINEHYRPDFAAEVEVYRQKGILFEMSGHRAALRDWNGETN